MKRRINLILVVAILFGLAAAWGTLQYIKHLETTYKASGQFVPVAVAKVNISARQVISDQMVQFTEMPSNYANPAAIGKPGDIIGKVARSDIYAGEQVLKNNIANPSDPSEGLAMIVEPGRRAMTLAVTDVTGVAGLLKPGDHVDVLGTVNIGNQAITSLIVQNVRVLAVNKSTTATVENKPVQTGTLTLSLNPTEAQQLTLAAEKGTIRVMLRTPADSDLVGVPSTNINQLIR